VRWLLSRIEKCQWNDGWLNRVLDMEEAVSGTHFHFFSTAEMFVRWALRSTRATVRSYNGWLAVAAGCHRLRVFSGKGTNDAPKSNITRLCVDIQRRKERAAWG
jgi:hypothetical protein